MKQIRQHGLRNRIEDLLIMSSLGPILVFCVLTLLFPLVYRVMLIYAGWVLN